jgi:hypothetical protein
MSSPTKETKKALPQPNSDFYQLVETLPVDELAVLKQVRTFMPCARDLDCVGE